MVECTGLENRQSRKVLVGSNPTASAIAAFAALLTSSVLTGCLHFGGMPGETHTDGRRSRQIAAQVIEHAGKEVPGCRLPKVTDTELVDVHGDGKIASERWTVTACGQRVRYLVTFPPTGRGTGFVVRPDGAAR